MNDQERRSMPLFGIGIVIKLTELTARQIRYYEKHDLIDPERTSGNQRLFSFKDVDRLLEIKNLLDKGLNIAGIKLMISEEEQKTRENKKKTKITRQELKEFLKQELNESGRYGKTSLRQGELSRFFN
ncbi:MerR family transcriptional regulator [Virgibacillus oceani]